MALKRRTWYRLLAVVVIALLLGGGYLGKIYYDNFVVENITVEGEALILRIPKGATTSSVADQIVEMGILQDEDSFRWMLEKKNYRGRNIVPGRYKIAGSMSNNVLINHLRAGNGRLDAHVTFNQARDLSQLSGHLTRELTLDSADVYAWLTNEDSIAKYGFNRYNIIAMFIPNTYFVNPDISVSGLMKRMAREFRNFWSEERLAKARECKLTQSEIVTLASIVYWETKKAEDMPKVAGVYMNRLRIGMPLQADPTLIFAHGDYSIQRVWDKHKHIDSPYNTYQNKGLPPGPIIIPPIVYIDAVLNYDRNDYLFFVAKEDLSGYSYFSKTHEQHMIYAQRYRRVMNRRNIF